MDAQKNFAESTVAVAPAPALTGVTLSVAAGQGARFPAAPFNVTVHPAGVAPSISNAEIVRVTDKGSGDDWTVDRGQEDTAAIAIGAGYRVILAPTALVFEQIREAIAAVTPLSGAGSPEGAVTAVPGTPYWQTDVGLWIKNSGSGNTGWISVITL